MTRQRIHGILSKKESEYFVLVFNRQYIGLIVVANNGLKGNCWTMVNQKGRGVLFLSCLIALLTILLQQ